MFTDGKAMNKHVYIPSSSVLFEGNIEEGNVDSGQSTNSFRPRFPPLQHKSAPNNEYFGELDQKQLTLCKKHEIEQRTLESATRSVAWLHDTEQVGIAAAEKLACQREVLIRSNKRLDNVSPNLSNGAKHLKSVHSLGYSLKKYFFGKKSDSECFSRQNMQSIRSPKPTSGRLNKTLKELSEKPERNYNYSSHPSTRFANVDPQSPLNQDTINGLSVNDRLMVNLNEMGNSITRLKILGEALGEEINDQNRLLDTMYDKIEDVDINIHDQRNVMNKLLGK